MGNAVTYSTNVDSITEPGKKCVLTSPIQVEGLTAETLLARLEKFVRTKHFLSDTLGERFVTSFRSEATPEGGIHTVSKVEVTGIAALIAGDLGMELHAVYNFFPERDEMVCDYYEEDSTLKEKVWSVVLRILRGPIRIEFFLQEYTQRKAGVPMQQCLATILKRHGYPALCTPDCHSPGGDGKSVISMPIDDPGLTTERWFEAEKGLHKNATVLEDGAVRFSMQSWLAYAGMAEEQYLTMRHDAKEDVVLIVDHAADSTCSSEQSTLHFKVLRDPTRVEMWQITGRDRDAGGLARRCGERFFQGAMSVEA